MEKEIAANSVISSHTEGLVQIIGKTICLYSAFTVDKYG
jgi:RNA-binding protein YhbY